MFNKIKDLKNLKDQASQMKTMLAEETINANAVHDKVNIIMDGNQEVLNVEIDQELLTPDKKEDLEKGIKNATNDAVKKAQRVMAQKMQSMGGLNIPGM